MRKLINRFRMWKDWCKYNHISKIKKFLVLMGLYHYDTFDNWKYYGK